MKNANPQPDTSLQQEMDVFLFRSQQRTAYGVAILGALLVAIQLVFILTMFRSLDAAHGFHSMRLLFLPAIVACVAMYEYLYGREIGRRLRRGLPPLPVPPFVSAMGEAIMPTIGVILFRFATDWPTALRSPPVGGYFLILMLSILRLDVRICVMVGVLEAASFLLLIVYAVHSGGAEGAAVSAQLGFPLSTVVIILIATALSTVIIRQMRRLVVDLIASHRERERTARELATTADARRKAEAVIWQKDRLLSILGHDLRTPLNGVAGLSELMARTPERFTTEEIRRYAGEIHQTSRHLRELVDNLMAWAQVRTDQMPCDPHSYTLAELIDPIAALFEPALRAKAITLEIEAPSGLRVVADRRMLQTVLRNILSNAAKFTPRGGTVRIRAQRDGTFASIAIRDSGDGFPPALAEQLSRKESVASSPGTENEEGTGIGLLLCNELMHRLGGTIEIGNDPENGAVVRLSIPSEGS